MSDEITVKEGHMYGRWRQPVNVWKNSGIHNDTTAQKVGMRGGTIPGTIHLNLFPPLFISLWGTRWFERGSLSIYYTYATIDREDVRAVLVLPPEGVKDVQVEAWVETKERNIVAKGTAAVGTPRELPYLQTQELRSADPSEMRILAGIKEGDVLPTKDFITTSELLEREAIANPEPLDWYKDSSPWGNGILSPSNMYRAMEILPERPDGKPLNSVTFYGATELCNINGPIMIGVPYTVHRKVICVGASAKTEYIWTDSYLEEKKSGKLVAKMRHLDRVMKTGSFYYEEK